MSAPPATRSLEDILGVVRRYWGFDQLRPLQEDAIRAGLASRDSLVVLPTGGGKSLCYQVPPILTDQIGVVISPLISLMKDQVDGLRACGYPAAALHSGMTAGERAQSERDALAGKCQLLFIAPERLMTASGMSLVERLDVRSFAVDEAHCISHWGHDFRPDYRRLAQLKKRFPKASMHAFTATATRQVRDDIVAQLGLRNPSILVGSFDRPNLIYRIIPRTEVYSQTRKVLERHKNEAAIVYCLSRRDTEAMAEFLRSAGVKAAHYHAGMEAGERRQTQDDFSNEKLDVVAATVAFGMGIDRSNVRCIVHASLPKSIEHYQQETGRAGRDGLEAECVLFYSQADVIKWDSLIHRSAAEAANPEAAIEPALRRLDLMRRFCAVSQCRHRTLVEHFDQDYERENCGACDACLGEAGETVDRTVEAQKILSCVARVQERFGVGHIVSVLRGANTERMRELGHDQLSIYGLMHDTDEKELRQMVYQLVDHNVLERTHDEYPTLRLNEGSWRVMRGEKTVRLPDVATRKVKKTRAETDSWEGVDRDLFESLKALRLELARERNAPPYTIFSDATLRGLARARPTRPDGFLQISGVGPKKLEDFGECFMTLIAQHCESHGLATDVATEAPPDAAAPPIKKPARPSPTRLRAFDLFRRGLSIKKAAATLDRQPSTAAQYLAEYIIHERPDSIETWVDSATYARVDDAIDELGPGPFKRVFNHLDGAVPYDTIRLVASHRATRES